MSAQACQAKKQSDSCDTRRPTREDALSRLLPYQCDLR